MNTLYVIQFGNKNLPLVEFEYTLNSLAAKKIYEDAVKRVKNQEIYSVFVQKLTDDTPDGTFKEVASIGSEYVGGNYDEWFPDKSRIVDAFLKLIEKYGNGEPSLFTFDVCSDLGVYVDGSTIDRIERSLNSVILYYNENTGDFDDISEFSLASLEKFYFAIKKWYKEYSE